MHIFLASVVFDDALAPEHFKEDFRTTALTVWQKQDSSWKLLARASFRLPQPA